MNKKTIEVNPDRIIYLANRFDVNRCLLLDAVTSLSVKDISDKEHRRSILRYCQERALEMYEYFNELKQLIESGEEESDD